MEPEKRLRGARTFVTFLSFSINPAILCLTLHFQNVNHNKIPKMYSVAIAFCLLFGDSYFSLIAIFFYFNDFYFSFFSNFSNNENFLLTWINRSLIWFCTTAFHLIKEFIHSFLQVTWQMRNLASFSCFNFQRTEAFGERERKNAGGKSPGQILDSAPYII